MVTIQIAGRSGSTWCTCPWYDCHVSAHSYLSSERSFPLSVHFALYHYVEVMHRSFDCCYLDVAHFFFQQGCYFIIVQAGAFTGRYWRPNSFLFLLHRTTWSHFVMLYRSLCSTQTQCSQMLLLRPGRRVILFIVADFDSFKFSDFKIIQFGCRQQIVHAQ